VFAKGGTILNVRFPGDRTVQADRSKDDDAADRSRIYGVAKKSAPDEQGYKVNERGVHINVPKDGDVRGGNNYLSSLLRKSSCRHRYDLSHVLYLSGEPPII